MVPGIGFPEIALPDHQPTGAEPWPGHVPQVGTLNAAEADALAAVLARHTSTPDRCWFCTWDGSDAQLDLPHGQTDGDLRIQRRPSTGAPTGPRSRSPRPPACRLAH